MNTLRQVLDEAWKRHDRDSEALAAELQSLAATLPDDDDGAEAVRLARHTMLVHLADAAGLQRFLSALPTGAALDAQRLCANWALALLEEQPAAAPPDAAAWATLADVAQVEILRGRLSRARSLALAPEAAAAVHLDAAARRAYAATAHNLALALRTGPRTPAHDQLMIEMAELERRAWSRAGTWLQVQRADYHLALCHALAGHGAQAQAHAAACLQACRDHAADAVEHFFAHECSVHAALAAGDAAGAALHRTQMAHGLDAVPDAGLKAWCAQTLAALPV